MERTYKSFLWIIAAVVVAGAAAALLHAYRTATRPIIVMGAVIRKDADPRRQSPIPDAKVSVLGNSIDETVSSDASGLFKLSMHPWVRTRPITLRFEHPEYKPLDTTVEATGQLYVIRMEPLVRDTVAEPDHSDTAAKPSQVANVRVRYAIKNQTTLNVGSLAKQFEVVNKGNVPCKGQRPCSPDGKWKATTTRLPLDAGKGNEFRNIRVSCIAGPCPFTRLDTKDLSRPARNIVISATNWSDTASFLVEAEVTRTMTTDMVRQSYPFITGESISFALPPAAEGPSLIVDINGEEIVFPIGPNLILSWTTCSVEVAQGGTKVYRCELKPGYEVQQ